ncbi:MAG: ribosome silencing factor [Bacteroidales bacterium]|nr:ribosome silencing factor [Bacteroidales bacterium]
MKNKIKNQESELLVIEIIEAIQQKKGKNIISLNLGKLEQSICDYFIICHADSTTQVNAIVFGIEDYLKKTLNIKPLSIEGTQNSQWVLLDYGDVVVHVFLEEYRGFYKLETLWADAEEKKHTEV